MGNAEVVFVVITDIKGSVAYLTWRKGKTEGYWEAGGVYERSSTVVKKKKWQRKFDEKQRRKFEEKIVEKGEKKIFTAINTT